MRISNRELGLLWITLAVILIAMGYWWISPKLTHMREQKAQATKLENDRILAEHEIARKDQYQQQLQNLREELPHHAEGARVTAELLKILEQIANDHGLVLLKRSPEAERRLEDLFELAIDCTWEGNLSALAHFLFDIQSKGMVFDISMLSVAPKPGNTDLLKGRFTIDCAYTREGTKKTTEDKAGEL